MPAPACPQGHASDDPLWCDVCGLAMAPAPPSAPPAAPTACAVCGDRLDGRFCETCGHDSAVPTPAPTGTEPVAARARTWTAVVRADRAWFEEVRRQGGADAGTLEFPRHSDARHVVLTGALMAIGRRDAARGTAPEIDLAGLDPGVSAAHAVLVVRPDGGWDVVDVGSRNGTTLEVAAGRIPAHRPVPLADGGVIHLGAWTTITVTTG